MATKVPRRVTVEWLEERGACPEQVRRFKRLWPDGATVTKTNLLKAADKGLAVDWLANNLRSSNSVYTAAVKYWRGTGCVHRRLCKHEREYQRLVAQGLWQFIKEQRRA